MSVSSESAEQLMRLYIDETEFILKISGIAIKNVATALYVASKDTSSKSGKARLKTMLKSDGGIKIVSVKKEDMEKFVKEAKNYGILYCVISKKSINSEEKSVDVMVRAEDAPQVNYLVEKFKLDTVDKATIECTASKELESQNIEIGKEEIGDSVVDDILSELPLIEEEQKNDPQLENLSMNKEKSEEQNNSQEKKSVRKEIEEIKREKQAEEQLKKLQKEKGIIVPNATEIEGIFKNEKEVK